MPRTISHLVNQLIHCGSAGIMVLYPKWKVHREDSAMSKQCMLQRHVETVQEMQMDVEGHWKQSIATKRGYESFAGSAYVYVYARGHDFSFNVPIQLF